MVSLGTPSFCARVEAKTKAWANIQGATSTKFGIYYGRTKSDPTRKYRFSKRFGATRTAAFAEIRTTLLALIDAGTVRDFLRIQANPLSQMFKAKILSLYFPDIYLNVCSSEHLEIMAAELGLPEGCPASEYQHLLLVEKRRSPTARRWSNPKFMSFLFARFIRHDLHTLAGRASIRKPRKKTKRRVDFEEMQRQWGKIGRMSEEFALAWERERLVGLGFAELAARIDDRRDRPGYGYDFRSYTGPGVERQIEVKAIGFDHKEQCYRFYLSGPERSVARLRKHHESYYFYLVRFGKNGKPQALDARQANEVLSKSEVLPCAYVVRLEINRDES